MEFLRVETFAFHGLEHLFEPKGLPLVEKADRSLPSPTTSVLIRGAAGAGKSTLALALAHAIAARTQGVVLYLLTESVPADVAFKAHVLGLPAPVRYRLSEAHDVGSVVVHQLANSAPEAIEKSAEQLQSMAVEAAYEIVRREEGSGGAPIRAVVVDGLGLPERDHIAEKLPRNDFVSFLFALESRGISPVVVEEAAGSAAAENFAFAVDVVLTLGFVPSADSGELIRQLVVAKSRYSESTPGPHDTVLDRGIPTVWPAIRAVPLGPAVQSPGYFLPLDKPSSPVEAIIINRPAVILSDYEAGGVGAVRVFDACPGRATLTVTCGPTITIQPGRTASRDVSARSGPAALAWRLREALSSGRYDSIILHRLDFLIDLPRFREAIPGLLDALVKTGLQVLVHGSGARLSRVADQATLVGYSAQRYLTSDRIVVDDCNFRRASSWRTPLPGIEAPPADSNSDAEVTSIARLAKLLDEDRLEEAYDFVKAPKSGLKWGGDSAPAIRLRCEQALLFHKLGLTRTAGSALRDLASRNLENVSDPSARSAVGWTATELGSFGLACQVARRGIDSVQPPESMVALWNALWCMNTDTTTDLKLLTAATPQLRELQAGLLAHALAARRRSHVDLGRSHLQAALGEDLVERDDVRFFADLLMAASIIESWAAADIVYERLLEDGLGSRRERADLLFNRGVIRERTSRREEALSFYREALQANPFLEPAKDRIAALAPTNRNA